MVEYTYNASGIRISKTDDVGGANETVTSYLIDQNNPTGYAQVLEEWTDKGSTATLTTYTLGDDVIAQAKSDWTWNTSTEAWDFTTADDTQYLVYDGHGSTRQLVNASQTIDASYSYDAYGTMLGGNPTTAPATNLLYTGEQYDANLQQYYLRARYYNPSNGTFNRVDPYAGNTQDPQSLHKYLYVHNNPVNGIDPTGQFSIVQMSVNMAIQGIAMKVLSPIIKPVESIVTQGLIKGLLPFDILNQLKGARLSAIMAGGSLSGIAAKGLAVGFGGGLEALYSPFTNTAGLYAYSEWVIGVTGARTGAMAVAKAGLVFNAPNLGAYEGNFRSITFPIRRLPKNVRETIIRKFALTSWEALNLPKVGNLQAKVQNLYRKAKLLPKMIDGSTQCTIFYTPGTHGPFGISISKIYLPGNAGLVAFGMQHYNLLLGDPNAKLH